MSMKVLLLVRAGGPGAGSDRVTWNDTGDGIKLLTGHEQANASSKTPGHDAAATVEWNMQSSVASLERDPFCSTKKHPK